MRYISDDSQATERWQRMVWISDILTVSPVSTDTDVAMARWSVMRHEVHESDDVVEPKECQNARMPEAECHNAWPT